MTVKELIAELEKLTVEQKNMPVIDAYGEITIVEETLFQLDRNKPVVQCINVR